MTGVVATFDEEAGLGTIAPGGGGPDVPFQCLAIADGTRAIAPGTAVEFMLIPKLGRYEAWAIRPA